jgi:serine phosphatase RsbU (regulator of sigma subunit)
MLVALLVGAIRSTAEADSDPSAILAALNRRLLGRGDARATCAALRIAADGSARLANSGHLPPYLNGELLEVEGSLPLGLFEGAEPSLLEFQLASGDRLVLVSDGIAEAMDERGNLFGFDRVLELMRTHPSAAKVADTAQAFGQEDDICVIAVTRDPASKRALV